MQLSVRGVFSKKGNFQLQGKHAIFAPHGQEVSYILEIKRHPNLAGSEALNRGGFAGILMKQILWFSMHASSRSAVANDRNFVSKGNHEDDR